MRDFWEFLVGIWCYFMKGSVFPSCYLLRVEVLLGVLFILSIMLCLVLFSSDVETFF